MGATEPWLATVLPVLNEEEYIESCLQSLIDQSLPANEHTILVLDGGSTDATTEIVQKICEGLDSTQHPSIHLLDNPGRFVPHARNLALQHLPESITHVLEFNGHVEIERDHLIKMKEAWTRLRTRHERLAGLGCRVIGNDSTTNTVESIIDATLSSPLGGGTGQFAQFHEEGKTNVPAFALHLRSALEEVDGWDESFLTSQDSDLSMRLLKAGYVLCRTPKAVAKMRRRTSFRSWFLMSHRYGFWRTKVLLKHPRRLVLRELLPLFGLISTSMLLLFNPMWSMMLIGAYCAVLFLFGLLSAKKGPSHILGVPFCLLILHTAFTIGLFDGLIRKGGASRDR
ncbi:MAG: Putative mycofactocin biosynthesis glycosyltransferase MftF [Candidatus Poseidoniaceae archaeon]|nr:MAG: Putative mycofactocin biosynthesis glycosyltransferase MftF [Candidatus Poseidoniaceae archaeon]